MAFLEKILQNFLLWSFAHSFARSRLPQASALIPAIGYAVIWSDQFKTLLQSHELLGASWFSLMARLQFLWWGAIMMTVGVGVYFVFCPQDIRQSGDARSLVRQLFQVPDGARMKVYRAKAVELWSPHHPAELRKFIYGEFSPNQLYLATEMLKDQERNFTHRDNVSAADTVITAYFVALDHSRPIARRISNVAMAVGALLFLTPSLEVSWRVLKVLISQLTSAL